MSKALMRECPKCHYLNSPTLLRCESCSQSLSAPPPSATSKTATQIRTRVSLPGTSSNNNMLVDRGRTLKLSHLCDKCGASSSPAASACSACGHPLQRGRLQLSPTRSGSGRDDVDHLLVTSTQAPVRLRPGCAYIIGRIEDADLILPSEQVSRRHARVVCTPTSRVLEDLGSANGTYVNGKRIEGKHELQVGDVIIIGGMRLEYHAAAGEELDEASARRAMAKMETREMDAEQVRSDWSSRSSAFGGQLGDISVLQVLEFLHDTDRSGRLEVTGVGGSGNVDFVEGEIVAVQSQVGVHPARGGPALLYLGAILDGTFEFTPQRFTGERELSEPTFDLLSMLRRPGSEARDKLRVLLVEDDEQDILLFKDAMTQHHAMVLQKVAQSGQEALAYLRLSLTTGNRPELVLLDLNLKDLSGFEVLEAMRADPGLVDLPVVVLTASERDEDVRAAFRAGASSYVCKPSDPTRLGQMIQHISGYWSRISRTPSGEE